MVLLTLENDLLGPRRQPLGRQLSDGANGRLLALAKSLSFHAKLSGSGRQEFVDGGDEQLVVANRQQATAAR
jgi:hypothetical protein